MFNNYKNSFIKIVIIILNNYIYINTFNYIVTSYLNYKYFIIFVNIILNYY